MSFKQYLIEGNSDYTVYFDMDSVLADFHKKVMEYKPDWSKKDLEDQTMSDEEFWPVVINIPNFWESLEPIPSGIEMLKYAKKQGFNVEILSSPSRNDKRSNQGKHKWVNQHLSSLNLKVNLVRAVKKQEYAKSNTMLVDDLKKNIQQFKSKGGQTMYFKDGATKMSDFKKALKELTSQEITESIETLGELDKALDKIASGIKDVRLTKHFIERIQERGIEMDTIVETIEKFLKRYENSLKQSQQMEISGLIKHMLEHLNIAMSYDTKGTPGNLKDDVLNLVTVMKKKNFVPNNPNEPIYKVR
jgi:hypothetical protein